jgi:hypothetical protein
VLVLGASHQYDTVLLPGLYWLSVTRENWRRTTVVTALMFSISFGTFALLRIIRPGGFDPLPLAPLLATTFEDFRSMWMAYPPALGFAIPLVLTAIGFSSAERFSRASAVFGVFLFVPFLVASNFAEFRAEVPILLLLLPCTLRGLQILLGEDLRAQRPPFSSKPPDTHADLLDHERGVGTFASPRRDRPPCRAPVSRAVAPFALNVSFCSRGVSRTECVIHHGAANNRRERGT